MTSADRLPGDRLQPWLWPLTIFLTLWVPFLVTTGWGYRNAEPIDLPSFWAASVTVFTHHQSPYDPVVLRRATGPGSQTRPYLYPPPSLLFFGPLAAMSLSGAHHVVLVVNHLLFLALVWIIPLGLLRAGPGRAPPGALLVCLAYTLTFFPVNLTLYHGQVNFLLLAFLVAFWDLARRHRPVLAGLFLALAIVLKTYPVVLIPLLLLIGRRREALTTFLWLAAATLAAMAVLPWAVWHDWFTAVLPIGGYMNSPPGLSSPAAIWNQSLNGFFARALTDSPWSHPPVAMPGTAKVLAYGGAALVAAATALAVRRSSGLHSDGLDRTMFVALPAIFLIAPFSWEHHLVFLLPTVLFLLTCRTDFPTGPKIAFHTAAVTSAVALTLPPLLPYKFFAVTAVWALAVLAALRPEVKNAVA